MSHPQCVAFSFSREEFIPSGARHIFLGLLKAQDLNTQNAPGRVEHNHQGFAASSHTVHIDTQVAEEFTLSPRTVQSNQAGLHRRSGQSLNLGDLLLRKNMGPLREAFGIGEGKGQGLLLIVEGDGAASPCRREEKKANRKVGWLYDGDFGIDRQASLKQISERHLGCSW